MRLNLKIGWLNFRKTRKRSKGKLPGALLSVESRLFSKCRRWEEKLAELKKKKRKGKKQRDIELGKLKSRIREIQLLPWAKKVRCGIQRRPNPHSPKNWVY